MLIQKMWMIFLAFLCAAPPVAAVHSAEMKVAIEESQDGELNKMVVTGMGEQKQSTEMIVEMGADGNVKRMQRGSLIRRASKPWQKRACVIEHLLDGGACGEACVDDKEDAVVHGTRGTCAEAGFPNKIGIFAAKIFGKGDDTSTDSEDGNKSEEDTDNCDLHHVIKKHCCSQPQRRFLQSKQSDSCEEFCLPAEEWAVSYIETHSNVQKGGCKSVEDGAYASFVGVKDVSIYNADADSEPPVDMHVQKTKDDHKMIDSRYTDISLSQSEVSASRATVKCKLHKVVADNQPGDAQVESDRFEYAMCAQKDGTTYELEYNDQTESLDSGKEVTVKLQKTSKTNTMSGVALYEITEVVNLVDVAESAARERTKYGMEQNSSGHTPLLTEHMILEAEKVSYTPKFVELENGEWGFRKCDTATDAGLMRIFVESGKASGQFEWSGADLFVKATSLQLDRSIVKRSFFRRGKTFKVDMTARTKTKWNDHSPVWTENLYLCVPTSLEGSINLQLIEDGFRSSTLVGSVDVPFVKIATSHAYALGEKREYTVSGKGHKGEFKVEFHFSPSMELVRKRRGAFLQHDQIHKMFLRTGDLVFFAGNTASSNIIRDGEYAIISNCPSCSPWSHVGIVVDDSGHVMVAESSTNKARLADCIDGQVKTGVELLDLEDKLSCGKYDLAAVRQIDLTGSALSYGDVHLRIKNYYDSVKNTPYSALSKLIVGWAGLAKHSNPDSFFCSEFVAKALQEAGILSKIEPAGNYLPAHFSTEAAHNGFVSLTSGISYRNEVLVRIPPKQGKTCWELNTCHCCAPGLKRHCSKQAKNRRGNGK